VSYGDKVEGTSSSPVKSRCELEADWKAFAWLFRNGDIPAQSERGLLCIKQGECARLQSEVDGFFAWNEKKRRFLRGAAFGWVEDERGRFD
jgi:hypothetical protein